MTITDIMTKYPENPRVNENGLIRLIPGMQISALGEILTVVWAGVTGCMVKSARLGEFQWTLYENPEHIV